MSAWLEDGFIVVDCAAGDSAVVEIRIGKRGEWQPAFRDWSEGVRVAKVRPNGQTGKQLVSIRVDGRETLAGVVKNL